MMIATRGLDIFEEWLVIEGVGVSMRKGDFKLEGDGCNESSICRFAECFSVVLAKGTDNTSEICNL